MVPPSDPAEHSDPSVPRSETVHASQAAGPAAGDSDHELLGEADVSSGASPGSEVAGATAAATRDLRAQGRKTLRKLLRSGAAVFEEHGYHAARVDDIVARAKTSHGTFYLYFTNKEDLLRALAVQCAEELDALAHSLGPVTPNHGGWQELRGWLERYTVAYNRNGPVLRAWMEDQSSDRDLRQMGSNLLDSIVDGLERRVEEAAAPNLPDTHAGTQAMLAMIERFTYFRRSRRFLTDDSSLDTLTTLIHRAFFGAPIDAHEAPVPAG